MLVKITFLKVSIKAIQFQEFFTFYFKCVYYADSYNSLKKYVFTKWRIIFTIITIFYRKKNNFNYFIEFSFHIPEILSRRWPIY